MRRRWRLASVVFGERDEPEEEDGEHDVQDHLPVPADAPGEPPERVMLLAVVSPRRHTAADVPAVAVAFVADLVLGSPQRVLVHLRRLRWLLLGATLPARHLDVEHALVELDGDRGGGAAACGEVEALGEVAPLPAAAPVDVALAADLEAPRRLQLHLQLVLAEP